jgi:hypothetical protein
VFAVAGAALLFAASLFGRVTVEGRIAAASTSHAEVLRHALVAGYRTVLGSLRARLVVGLMIAQKFVLGCLNVLIVVTAFRVLDAGPGAVGYMTAAIGIGGLIGALGALTLVGRQLATTFGVALAAGEVVIREGEVGDRFYIVDHGQLEVVGPGVQATAGAGD